MKISIIVLGTASMVAAAGSHNHKHRHVNRGSPVVNRGAMVTETVAATATVFQLSNGQDLSYEEVQAGIAAGKYVLVDAPATTTPTAAPTTTPAVQEAAEFVQHTSATSSAIIAVSVSASLPVTTSSTSVVATPSSTSSEKASSTSEAVSTATGSNVDFPSGTIPCSKFPSEYGAVYLDWLELEGWSGVQLTPDYTPGDASISTISEVTAGSGGCQANSFCSYACGPGSQKSQWPKAQGSLGQSIGGLYCNSDGMLELSNTNFSTICIEGTGSISVKNTLSEQVAICRTDYPGYEAETIPTVVSASSTSQLTCPDASKYYTWEGAETSAQYYVNPAGADVSDACVWGSSGSNLGNWAPVNLGVGMDTLGVTWVSMFANSPTNPDGTLDFTITLKGDISAKCSYSGGKYYDDNGENDTGCTVEVTAGGTAYYELS